jgi:hypothetical protein
MMRLRIPEHRKSVEFQHRENAVEVAQKGVCPLAECQGRESRVGPSRRQKSVILLPEYPR